MREYRELAVYLEQALAPPQIVDFTAAHLGIRSRGRDATERPALRHVSDPGEVTESVDKSDFQPPVRLADRSPQIADGNRTMQAEPIGRGCSFAGESMRRVHQVTPKYPRLQMDIGGDALTD